MRKASAWLLEKGIHTEGVTKASKKNRGKHGFLQNISL